VLHYQRLSLASHHKVFARNIVTNKVLEEMAKCAPTTLQALREIKGISPKTTKTFGLAFVKTVVDYLKGLEDE
jgi:superfamily II DNA helicase RecQ